MLFWQVLSMVFIAEMGDKTQLLMVALAARYPLRRIIPGVALATLALCAVAAGAGVLLGEMIPTPYLRLGAAVAYLAFALSAVRAAALPSPDTEENPGRGSVFLSFFLAECGDKTQLCVMTLAAGLSLADAAVCTLAAALGLFLADLIGLLAGLLLRRRLPRRALNILSAAVFAVFGVLTLTDASRALLSGGAVFLLPAAGGAAFLIGSAVIAERARRLSDA